MTTIEPLSAAHLAVAASWLSLDANSCWLTSEWRTRAADPTALAIVIRNKRNRVFLVLHDGNPAGLTGLADIDEADRCAMAWYLLGDKSLGGKGVVSEAVGQLCRLGFDSLSLSCIYAWIMEPNAPSRRVLEKNHFREAGRLRHATSYAGAQVDRIYFDLIPEDLR